MDDDVRRSGRLRKAPRRLGELVPPVEDDEYEVEELKDDEDEEYEGAAKSSRTTKTPTSPSTKKNEKSATVVSRKRDRQTSSQRPEDHEKEQRDILGVFEEFCRKHLVYILKGIDVGHRKPFAVHTQSSFLRAQFLEALEKKKLDHPRKKRDKGPNGENRAIRTKRPSMNATKLDPRTDVLSLKKFRHDVGMFVRRSKAKRRRTSTVFDNSSPLEPANVEWFIQKFETELTALLTKRIQRAECTSNVRRSLFNRKNASQSSEWMAAWHFGCGDDIPVVLAIGDFVKRFATETGSLANADRGPVVGVIRRLVRYIQKVLVLVPSEHGTSKWSINGDLWYDMAARDGRTAHGAHFHPRSGAQARDPHSAMVICGSTWAQLHGFRFSHPFLAEQTPMRWFDEVGGPPPRHFTAAKRSPRSDEDVDLDAEEEAALRDFENRDGGKKGPFFRAAKNKRSYVNGLDRDWPTRTYDDGRLQVGYALAEAPNKRWARDGVRTLVQDGPNIYLFGVLRLDTSTVTVAPDGPRPTLLHCLRSNTDSLPPDPHYEQWAVTLVDLDAATSYWMSVRLESSAVGSAGDFDEFPVASFDAVAQNGGRRLRRLVELRIDVNCTLVWRKIQDGPVIATVPVVVGQEWLDPKTRCLLRGRPHPAAAELGFFEPDDRVGIREDDPDPVALVPRVVSLRLSERDCPTVGRLTPIDINDNLSGRRPRPIAGIPPCQRVCLSVMDADMDPESCAAAVAVVPGKGHRGDDPQRFIQVEWPRHLFLDFYDACAMLVRQSGTVYRFNVDAANVTGQFLGPFHDLWWDELKVDLPRGIMPLLAAAATDDTSTTAPDRVFGGRFLVSCECDTSLDFPFDDNHRHHEGSAGSVGWNGFSIEAALVGNRKGTVTIEFSPPGDDAFTTFLVIGSPRHGPVDDDDDDDDDDGDSATDSTEALPSRIRFYVLESVDLRVTRRGGADASSTVIFQTTKKIRFDQNNGVFLDRDAYIEMADVKPEARVLGWPTTMAALRTGTPDVVTSHADTLYEIQDMPVIPTPVWPSHRSLRENLCDHGFRAATPRNEARAFRVTLLGEDIITDIEVCASDGRPPSARFPTDPRYDGFQPPKQLEPWTRRAIRREEAKLRRDVSEATDAGADDLACRPEEHQTDDPGPGLVVKQNIIGPHELTFVASEDCVVAIRKRSTSNPAAAPVTRYVHIDGLRGRLLDVERGVHVTFCGVSTVRGLLAAFGDERCGKVPLGAGELRCEADVLHMHDSVPKSSFHFQFPRRHFVLSSIEPLLFLEFLQPVHFLLLLFSPKY